MRVAKWSRSQIGCISRGVRVVSAGARQALACWWHVCACRAPADAGRARRNASYLRTGPLSSAAPMALPLSPPLIPQLARPAKTLPAGDGWIYEPKWDGFRAIAFVDG